MDKEFGDQKINEQFRFGKSNYKKVWKCNFDKPVFRF